VEKSLIQYLVGDQPIAGLIMSDTGEKVSIYDAWKRNLIRRGITMSLKTSKLLCLYNRCVQSGWNHSDIPVSNKNHNCKDNLFSANICYSALNPTQDSVQDTWFPFFLPLNVVDKVSIFQELLLAIATNVSDHHLVIFVFSALGGFHEDWIQLSGISSP